MQCNRGALANRARRWYIVIVCLVVGVTIAQAQVSSPGWQWAQAGVTSGPFGSSNFLRASAVDGQGNVYVAGSFAGTVVWAGQTQSSLGNGLDTYLLKYNSTGQLLWARQSECQGQDGAIALAVDSVGNAYVTGYYEWNAIQFGSLSPLRSARGSSQTTTFVVKYDANGSAVQAWQPGGEANSRVRKIALDTKGHLYLAGTFDEGWPLSVGSTTLKVGVGKGEEWFVAKYTTSGLPVWAEQSMSVPFGSVPFGNPEDITGLVVDKQGSLWLAGNTKIARSFGTVLLQSAGSDSYLLKISATGRAEWGWTMGSAGEDTALGLALDFAGNTYVAGVYQQTMRVGTTTLTAPRAGVYTYLARFDPRGHPRWARQLTGTGITVAVGAGTDACGGIYLNGLFDATTTIGTRTLTSAGSTDVFTACFDSLGALTWAMRGGGLAMDRTQTMTVAPNGTIICGGDYLGGAAQWGTTILPFVPGNSHVWVGQIVPACAPLPDLAAGPNQTVCAGSQVSIGGQPLPAGMRYEWTVSPVLPGFPATTTTVQAQVPLTNAAPTYTFVLTGITPAGCRFQDTVEVHVTAPGRPLVTDEARCQPGPLTLRASGAPAGGRYRWYTTAAGGNPVLEETAGTFTTPSLNVTTQYYVTVVTPANCEGPRQPVAAIVYNLPVAVAGADQQVCSGQTVQLGGKASEPGVRYQWLPATGLSDATAAQPILRPINLGIQPTEVHYTLQATSSQGCTTTDTIRVRVWPIPPAPTITRAGKILTSNATAGNQWLLNDRIITGANTPAIIAAAEGRYTVMVRTPAGCLSEASVLIEVPLSELLPNIITPNGDGRNDIFPVHSLSSAEWNITIFSRWGRQLYQKTSYQDDWGGEGVSDGLYYYLLHCPATNQWVKGWVQVVR